MTAEHRIKYGNAIVLLLTNITYVILLCTNEPFRAYIFRLAFFVLPFICVLDFMITKRTAHLYLYCLFFAYYLLQNDVYDFILYEGRIRRPLHFVAMANYLNVFAAFGLCATLFFLFSKRLIDMIGQALQT